MRVSVTSLGCSDESVEALEMRPLERYLFKVFRRESRRAGPLTSPVERVKLRRAGKEIRFNPSARGGGAATMRPAKTSSLSIAENRMTRRSRRVQCSYLLGEPHSRGAHVCHTMQYLNELLRVPTQSLEGIQSSHSCALS